MKRERKGDFGARLRTVIMKHAETQLSLMARTGIDNTLLSDYLLGRMEPNRQNLRRLLLAYPEEDARALICGPHKEKEDGTH